MKYQATRFIRQGCWLALWLLIGQASVADSGFLTGLGLSIHDSPGSYGLLQDLGVQSIRTDAPWQQIETAPGQYHIPQWLDASVNAAVARKLEPLIILDYGNSLYGGDKPTTPEAQRAFANYARFVVDHFKGKVRYFDVWNEWETHTGKTKPGSVADYISLTKLTYPAIKAANPNAVVLSGGISDIALSNLDKSWLAQYVAAGGLQYVDGLSIHTYVFTEKDQGAYPESSIELVDRVYKLATKANGGKPVDIYVTEMGYPTFTARIGFTDTQAAQYLARFYLLAAARSYVRGVWWYSFIDQGTHPTNKEHHFGVYGPDLRPKAAANMFAEVTSLLKGSKVISVNNTGADYQLTLEQGGQRHIVEWSDSTPVTRYPAASPGKRASMGGTVLRAGDKSASNNPSGTSP